jgi:HlyD family secretion protein
MKKVFVGFGVLILIAIFGWSVNYFLKQSKSEKVSFETIKPSKKTIIKDTRATGVVEPREEIEVKPQVSGIIEKLFVEAGDLVKKGDLVATIKVIPSMANLSAAENRLSKARVALKNSKKVYDRQKELLIKGVVSQSEFEQFELNYFTAIEEEEGAEENLQIIRDGYAKGSTTSNTNIKATITGTILEVPVEIGKSVIETNTMNDGTTIVSIADMDDLIFRGNVDESEVGKLKLNMPLEITIGAIDDKVFDAKLEHIAPKGTEESGSIQFEIKAGLKKLDSVVIRAGYSANASIVLMKKDSVLSIEERILQFDENDEPFVEIKKAENNFEKMYVKLGVSDGVNVQITNGLTLDDEVKVLNNSKLN